MDNDARAAPESKWRLALGLLRGRQRIVLALLTAFRIVVGFCDIALAAAMYILFLLLQGRTPTHRFWWSPQTIIAAALFGAAMVLARALTDILSSRLAYRQIQNLYTDLLLRLAQGYCQMNWRRFIQRNRSELANHAVNTAREAADFYHRAVELVASVVIMLAITIALLYQSLVMAAAFGCGLILFYGIHRLLVRNAVGAAASHRESSLQQLHHTLADTLSIGQEIRAYGNQSFFLRRIQQQAKHLAVACQRSIFRPQVARIVSDQGIMLIFLGFILVVALRQGDARQLLSVLAFFFVLSRRLLPLVSQISLIAGQMENSYQSVRIVSSELEECQRYGAPAVSTQMPAAGFVLELHHVSFSYRPGFPVLHDINLSLRPGEAIVLRGPSGIGKSSLLDLIAGVLQPESGTIHVHQRDIAYVPQEVPILDESIRDNLLFGMRGISDDALMKALAIARLDQFVRSLPLGLDTRTGCNGALLSGGERQRLGLARAILRSPQLLLLDETTSALDVENEHQVLENLRAAGLAVVLVTHRLHAFHFPHREYWLQNSYLVELPGAPASQNSPVDALASNSLQSLS